MPHHATHRLRSAGFTLVELLVVIAIIGVLVSLLLPAVNSSREAARRIQCVSNMRQVTQAILNYETANAALPPPGLLPPPKPECTWPAFGGTGSARDCFRIGVPADHEAGPFMSWVVVVLPFLEEQALFDTIDFSENIFKQPFNGTDGLGPQAQEIASILCPSDQIAQVPYRAGPFTRDREFAKGNFAAYVSPSHIDHCPFIPGGLGGATPGSRVGQKLRKVIDGLSKTAVISEVRKRNDRFDQRGVWSLPWGGAALLAADVHHHFTGEERDDIRRVKRYHPSGDFLGNAQLPNTSRPDILFRCPDSDRARQEGMPCVRIDSIGGTHAVAPRSRHVGGVNFAALDGHVGFVTDEVDPISFGYLISSNDATVYELDNF